MGTIGCATTHDLPTQETVDSAQSLQRKALESVGKAVERAYQHFVSGKHPYTRLLGQLAAHAATPGHSRAMPFKDVEANQALPITPEIFFGTYRVQLMVKPGTSALALEKLRVEFLAAQASVGGILRDEAAVKALLGWPLELSTLRLLQPASSNHGISQGIALALGQRAALETWLHSEQRPPTPLEELHLKLLLALCEGGVAEALPSLLRLPGVAELGIFDVLLFAPLTSPTERRALRKHLERLPHDQRREYLLKTYGPTLAN